jgi:hypothetical protein
MKSGNLSEQEMIGFEGIFDRITSFKDWEAAFSVRSPTIDGLKERIGLAGWQRIGRSGGIAERY